MCLNQSFHNKQVNHSPKCTNLMFVLSFIMLYTVYVTLFQCAVLAMKCVVQEKIVKIINVWPVCVFIHIVFYSAL